MTGEEIGLGMFFRVMAKGEWAKMKRLMVNSDLPGLRRGLETLPGRPDVRPLPQEVRGDRGRNGRQVAGGELGFAEQAAHVGPVAELRRSSGAPTR